MISIGGCHFRVVGVHKKKGSAFGNSQDNFAIIPLGHVPEDVRARAMFGLQLIVKPRTPELIKRGDGRRDGGAARRAAAAAEGSRQLRACSRPTRCSAIYKTATKGIFAVLIGVVALSLVVGGIVIMNIMLMVVSERTREIGLRKALGARRRDIVWQILTESVTLSTFGGMVGTLLGFVFAIIISKVSPLPASVQVWSVVIGIGITAVVGLFFGMYPAMRAAKLDPIEALQSRE